MLTEEELVLLAVAMGNWKRRTSTSPEAIGDWLAPVPSRKHRVKMGKVLLVALEADQ